MLTNYSATLHVGLLYFVKPNNISLVKLKFILTLLVMGMAKALVAAIVFHG